MFDPTLYETARSVVESSIGEIVEGISGWTANVPSSNGRREGHVTLPLLVPQFWWLVLNTVCLKLKHHRMNAESYLNYLDEFYTGSTTSSHVAVYGDAYEEVRPIVADLAGLMPGDTVLDVASGRGYQAAEFARRGHRVTSLELVHDRAKTARDLHPSGRLVSVAGDAAFLPFKDDAFDIVVISLGLHCMPIETRLRVLGEFSRVTRKRVVILEPRPQHGWFMRYLYAAIGQILDESMYFWEFALSDFDTHLACAGLGVTRKQRCFHNLFVVYVCDPVDQPVWVPRLPDRRKPVPRELAEVVQ